MRNHAGLRAIYKETNRLKSKQKICAFSGQCTLGDRKKDLSADKVFVRQEIAIKGRNIMELHGLNIYITEYGIEIDSYYDSYFNGQSKWLFDLFNKDKSEFFYELAFIDEVKDSISIHFLQYIAKKLLSHILNSECINFAEIEIEPLDDEAIEEILPYVPFITGYTYVTADWIKRISEIFFAFYKKEMLNYKGTQKEYLAGKGVNITIPSRIYFHLVENNERNDLPFAFLATYTAEKNGKIVHFPLKNALVEFKNNSEELNILIDSIFSASRKSDFVKHYMETGDIYFPIKMSEAEAYAFLKEVGIFEQCGIVCRIPRWYTHSEDTIQIDIDEKLFYSIKMINQAAINYFVPKLIYHGVEITVDEAKTLLLKQEGLEIIKGKWVEINHTDLSVLLDQFENLSSDGTTLLEVLRSKAGIGTNRKVFPVNIEFSREDWIERYISSAVREIDENTIPDRFINVLRPYQKDAFFWLWGMCNLGFGVCLADDMGLGKTVEVISFLSKYKENYEEAHVLIVVPATLVANWTAEFAKFAPSTDVFILRGNNAPEKGKYKGFITITTYQIASKSDYLAQNTWDVVVLDEAQAIKNYYTTQTKSIKSLQAHMRIAMTGTPIENNVLELWSIFDFLNPGLLGNRLEFKGIYEQEDSHLRIRKLIQPFVLRRVKTDKSIISDLPEKNEIDISVNLTKDQIVLYKKAVNDMNLAIKTLKNKQEGQIIVLSSIMKLKQICNHPCQYYGTSEYDPELSGKFIMLRDISEAIYEKREKVLVFTQFKEIIPALDCLLEKVFKRKGAVIDGDTSMQKRAEIVDAFQAGNFPYMVLSLKTAGVGLNLTEANNVIHFDRWWNPAVENQATDRTYRIGQKQNVTVYKFISANTIEEVIDKMLKVKQSLADMYVNDIDSNVLLKLSPEELMHVVEYSGEDYE